VVSDAVAWLCRSPRRLAVGCVVLLTGLLFGGSLLFGNGAGAHQTAAPTATAATPAAQVPDADPYVKAAVAFVQQWSRLKPGETATQWQARLVPLTTSDLAEALKTTDPAQLPGVGPQGEPVVRYVAQSSALIAVPLSDGSSVLVTVVAGDQGTQVSDVQPNVGD
jgi:hypothetical protein